MLWIWGCFGAVLGAVLGDVLELLRNCSWDYRVVLGLLLRLFLALWGCSGAVLEAVNPFLTVCFFAVISL